MTGFDVTINEFKKLNDSRLAIMSTLRYPRNTHQNRTRSKCKWLHGLIDIVFISLSVDLDRIPSLYNGLLAHRSSAPFPSSHHDHSRYREVEETFNHQQVIANTFKHNNSERKSNSRGTTSIENRSSNDGDAQFDDRGQPDEYHDDYTVIKSATINPLDVIIVILIVLILILLPYFIYLMCLLFGNRSAK